MERGDVVFINLGNPPGGAGREQAGTRPAVVLSEGDQDPHNPMIVVVPFTTSSSANRFPYTLLIHPNRDNGLTNTSVALIFQIRAIDKNRVVDEVGSLSESELNRIEEFVREMLSL